MELSQVEFPVLETGIKKNSGATVIIIVLLVIGVVFGAYRIISTINKGKQDEAIKNSKQNQYSFNEDETDEYEYEDNQSNNY